MEGPHLSTLSLDGHPPALPYAPLKHRAVGEVAVPTSSLERTASMEPMSSLIAYTVTVVSLRVLGLSGSHDGGHCGATLEVLPLSHRAS